MTDPHNEWNNLFDELPIDVTPQEAHQQEVKKQSLAAFESSPPQPGISAIKSMGRILVKNRILQWTIVGVCLIGLGWVLKVGGQPAFALEKMVDRIVKSETAQWDLTLTIDGHNEQKVKVSVKPGFVRQEFSFQTVIIDSEAGQMLSLVPASKQAIITSLPNRSQAKAQFNQFELMRDGLRQAMSNPEKNVESLGEREFDGRLLIGFRFQAIAQPLVIWADPITEFPVRIELSTNGPPKTNLVMMNYEFDIDLDASLFSTEIPEGYKVLKQEAPQLGNEEQFIDSLRMSCECLDGEFPPSLSTAAIAAVSAKHLTQQIKILKLKTTGLTSEQLAEVTKITRGFTFSTMLAVDGNSDAHYAGKGVKLNDKERPIFWYKPKDSDGYRVIYADLTVQEQAVAPNIEAAKKLTL